MNPDISIAEARTALREQAKNGGAHCPTCGQMAKVYKRTINGQMAGALIALYKRGTWATWPDLLQKRADEAKLRYWGLIESSNGVLWRVTEDGRQFVEGTLSVPKYCRVFDSRPLGFEGKQITISDALGERFDLDKLMSA